MAEMIMALVLRADITHNVKPGQILEASADVINALQKDGTVEKDKGAVKAARSAGAQVVSSAVEQAEKARAQALTELQLEIAELEKTLAAASADVKPAVEQALVEKREALKLLG